MLSIRVLVVLIYVKLKSITKIVSYLTRFYVGAKKLLEKAQYFCRLVECIKKHWPLALEMKPRVVRDRLSS